MKKNLIVPYRKNYQRFNKLVNFENKTILDIGGNSGNLLHSSLGKIKEQNYTCVDICKPALEIGKQKFPNATWIYNNRYHRLYNENGNKDCLLPKLDKKDLVFMITVFIHNDLQENEYLINYGLEHCKETMIFTTKTEQSLPRYSGIITQKERTFIKENGYKQIQRKTFIYSRDFILEKFKNFNIKYLETHYRYEDVFIFKI